jgi:hypothetical protein
MPGCRQSLLETMFLATIINIDGFRPTVENNTEFSVAMGWPAKIMFSSAAVGRPMKIKGYFRRPNKNRQKISLCSVIFFLWQPKILSHWKLSSILVAHIWISLSVTCHVPSPTLSNAQILVPAACARPPLRPASSLSLAALPTSGRITPHPAPMPSPFNRSRAIPGHLSPFSTATRVYAPQPPTS